jgi:serine/alanine adding enzyme
MFIRHFRDKDRDAWNRYVMEANGSSCYHLIGWRDVIERTFKHKTHYIFSEDNKGQINGILPLVNLKSLLFGNYGVSLPYFNYGGVCADSEEIRVELLLEATRIAKYQKMDHIELRHVSNSQPDLPVKTSKVSMRLELPPGKEKLWNAFPSKLRSQIQRPIKERMYAKVGRQDELENFYSVFSVNMRDLGTPVYSKRFFKNILGEFPETTNICTVYTKENHPVASGFLIGFKGTLEIPWASSLRAFNRYSPNMLLYWTVLGFAYERGYKVFDFGRSTPGEGTYKFKEQWGAQPVQLHWHYWLKKGGSLPELNPKNPKYQLAIRFWKSLPVGFTNLIGPHIVKYLP